MDYSGIFKDGWVEKNAHVVLTGGAAANLVVRADVLPCVGQRLDVIVDGRTVSSEDVEAGSLDLRILLPPSPSSRRVELHWAHTSELSADDPRQAAALIKYLDLVALRAPSAIHVPSTLANSGLDFDGIHRDGWVEKEAHVVLSGGGAGSLVVRGSVPEGIEQRLRVILNGNELIDEALRPSTVDLRIPVPASDAERRVELSWAAAVPVGPDDPRQAAALLTFIGVASGGAPAALRRVPGDLRDPNLEYSGIYPDGWLEKEARVVLSGGPAGELVLRAHVPPRHGQQLDLVVDADAAISHPDPPEVLDVRIPVAASGMDRTIELRWSVTGPVAANDPREATALLRFLGVASGPPPSGIRAFPGDLADPTVEYAGIYEDGWLERKAWVGLAGGAARELVLRAQVAPALDQHLDVIVDGHTLLSKNVMAGPLELRIPAPAASAKRRIELEWASTTAVAPDDPRQVAAFLESLALVPKRRG